MGLDAAVRVLAVNCGSSTLKFQVLEVVAGSAGEQRLARGVVDRIGGHAAIDFAAGPDARQRTEIEVADHEEAARAVLDRLRASESVPLSRVEVVGHRVVHGGEVFAEPTIIDDEVIEKIEALSDLAPLHNAPALAAIRAARAVLGPAIPMVATFDTAFHRSLPERAARYAIPPELAARHHVYRYGFHGLAHRYMTERYAAITSTPLESVKIITLQLGSGCSVTAIEGGQSVDTSMGFTPLEGLVMGSRSGDIDPSVVDYLTRREGVEAEVVVDWLNTRSGLHGVSGRSSDVRTLLEAEAQGDTRAGLALEMLCYRTRKYVGAYLAALGGADALVFGGGIGENSPDIRARICAGMEWCGLTLDRGRNERMTGAEGPISADGSTMRCHVIPVDEELIVARDTVEALSQHAERP